MTKYSAKPVQLDGYRFASQAEAARYQELELARRANAISGLKVHPRWSLEVKGILVAYYEADFRYQDERGRAIVEDVKGVATPVYKLKKRLMRALYGIEIVEIDAGQYRMGKRSKRRL